MNFKIDKVLERDIDLLVVNNFINKDVTVLIEKYDEKKKVNIGHTTNYIEVAIPSKEGRVGQFISVKLQKSMILSK